MLGKYQKLQLPISWKAIKAVILYLIRTVDIGKMLPSGKGGDNNG